MATKGFRFVVTDQVRHDESGQLVLKLKPMASTGVGGAVDECYECVLSDFWFGSDVNNGDIVHVLDAKHDKLTNRLIVDNESGLLVRRPDVLISITSLMSAKWCARKAWLSTKFGGWSPTNRPMIIGNIVHQLFQESCRQRVRGITAIKTLFEDNINDYINDLYGIGITKANATEDVTPYFSTISDWMDRYVHSMSPIDDSNNSTGVDNPRLQVLKVVDIEDSVWSTRLGLRGFVDLTIKVAVSEGQTQTRMTMPLELKTGKASFSDEHIGQVGLYSVMLDERDSTHHNEGLLLYLKDKSEMRRIVTKPAVKRDLVQMRNRLMKYWRDVDAGPEPLNSKWACSRCEHLLDCCLTLQTLESHHLPQSDVMTDQLIPQVLSHLTATDLDFFKKWITLLNIEAKEMANRDMDSKTGFWTQSSKERESRGMGFGTLSVGTINDNCVTFVRSDKFTGDCRHFNLTDNVMRLWERVIISVDNNHNNGSDGHQSKRVAVAMGSLKRLDTDQIEVVLDKSASLLSRNYTYRMDHMSSAGPMTSNYTNLLRLMDAEDQQSVRLRNIIINRQGVSHLSKYKREIVTKGKHILRPLNSKQQKSVLSALSTDSYLLLRGMPGAGKTQTIIALIRLLVALNQSVLITSYTHAAVDNILLKLKQLDIDFLRIGAERRVDQSLQEFTVSAKTSRFTTVEDLRNYYSGVQVVASTCLGVSSHPMFTHRKFDYCIVDEASQVLLPTCLGPLFHSKRFLLVGDDKQLPPVVQSETARHMGLDQSLFVLLQNDTNTTDLTIQYRMNSEIMRVSNELTYNGVLKCSSLDVCNQTLTAKNNDNNQLISPSDQSPEDWLSQVMQNDLSKSVVFIETDSIPAPEVRDIKGKAFNEIEAKIVGILVTNLLDRFDITSQQIAVISPYNRQVRHLRDSVGADVDGLEINTVDQFQGRDKDVILYSCVRSSDTKDTISSLEILNDWRRLNVALTRAKRKLILVGSKSTLLKYAPFQQLFRVLRCDQILSLNENDLQ